jgi:uncharacterized membrane protein (DUF485 family)
MSTTTAPSIWDRIAARPAFAALLRAKRRFIIPATVFFLIYYFALPLLNAYSPELMSRKVGAHLSLAYVFALSQFPMAWILAGLYLRAAASFDRAAAELLRGESANGGQPE